MIFYSLRPQGVAKENIRVHRSSFLCSTKMTNVRTYNPSVRVGNWNEDIQLEEVKVYLMCSVFPPHFYKKIRQLKIIFNQGVQ